jgi:uncharacterized membrane protein YhaH (DUF805 family)
MLAAGARGMHHFRKFLWTSGTLGPSSFIIAIGTLYLLGLAGQMLTAPPVFARLGLWPFLLMQIVLTWAWFALHAQRLRDAGRGTAAAQGIAVIHVLAVVLLILVAVFLEDNAELEGWTPASIVLLRQIMQFSRGAGDPLTVLGLVACAALILAPAFSVWAAFQPSRAE